VGDGALLSNFMQIVLPNYFAQKRFHTVNLMTIHNGAARFYFFVSSRCRHLQGKQLFLCHTKAQIKIKNDHFHNFMKNKIPKVYQF
jgi:hypothetical protein